jgi:hypothetical protein
VLENICQHVLAFRSNFFGAITRRGGRDARVPVLRRFAASVGCADRNGLEISTRFTPQLSASTPTQPPGGRLPTLRCRCVSRPNCRRVRRRNRPAVGYPPYVTDAFHAPIVGEYTDATARQSVTHLTLPMRFTSQLSAIADATARQSVTHLTLPMRFTLQLSAVPT